MRVAIIAGAGAPFDGLEEGELSPHAGGSIEGDAVLVTGAPTPEHLDALRAFADSGRPVLGVASGFAALCAAGLLPGAVESLPAPAAAPAPTHARVEGRATPFTWAIPAGRIMRLGAGTPAVRYLAPDAPALEAAGRVVLRYCDSAGGRVGDGADVAGVCDARGNVVGLLAADGLGKQLVASLRLRL